MKANIPRNIRKYESKFIGGFTLRQIIFVVMGLCSFLAVVLLLKNIVVYEILCIIGAFFALPFFMIGFIKVSDLPFEKIAKMIYKDAIYKSNFRPYERGGFNNEKTKNRY